MLYQGLASTCLARRGRIAIQCRTEPCRPLGTCRNKGTSADVRCPASSFLIEGWSVSWPDERLRRSGHLRSSWFPEEYGGCVVVPRRQVRQPHHQALRQALRPISNLRGECAG